MNHSYLTHSFKNGYGNVLLEAFFHYSVKKHYLQKLYRIETLQAIIVRTFF